MPWKQTVNGWVQEGVDSKPTQLSNPEFKKKVDSYVETRNNSIKGVSELRQEQDRKNEEFKKKNDL